MEFECFTLVFLLIANCMIFFLETIDSLSISRIGQRENFIVRRQTIEERHSTHAAQTRSCRCHDGLLYTWSSRSVLGSPGAIINHGSV